MSVIALVFVVVLVVGGAMLSTAQKKEVRQIEREVERRREAEAALETWSRATWQGQDHVSFDVNFRNMVFAEERSSIGGGIDRSWGALRRVDGGRWERREDVDSRVAYLDKLRRAASRSELDATFYESARENMRGAPPWCELEEDLSAKLEGAYQAFRTGV